MADITASVVLLGNPAGTYNGADTYARNVWDMQAYGGLLYIGSGNSASAAGSGETLIDSNAGPRPVIVYDPATGLFTTEGTSGVGGTLNTEQIDTFRVIDFGGSEGTQLLVPDHDPRSDNNLAFFALKSGTWRRHAASGSIGAPTHTFDAVALGTKLIIGGGLIGYSQDLSAWNNAGGEATVFISGVTAGGGSRGYSCFVLGGVAYIAGKILTDGSDQWFGEINGAATVGTKLTHVFSTIFPSTLTSEVTSTFSPKQATMRRPVNFGTSLVFVGAGGVADEQWTPFGLYRVDEVSGSGGLDSATFARLTLPNSAVPYDILTDGTTLWVLGAHTSGSDTVVGVYSTTDLSAWTEEFTFLPDDVDSGSQGQAFARSFEKIDGVWYFGLGSNLGTQPANVGDILAYEQVSATVPDAPTIGTATAGIRQASVAFTPPADDGGATITGYTATSTPGSVTGTGAASPITVTGLAAGVSYTFTVHATNSVGDSAESSASNSVEPTVATYYVRAADAPGGAGSDSNAGTGQGTGSAKLTLAGVVALGLSAGDLVHMRGTFKETFAPSANGSSGNLIEWRGDYSGSVFTTGGGKYPCRVSGAASNNQTASRTNALASSATYNQFTNITFDGATVDCISLTSPVGVVFDKCVIQGMASNGQSINIAGASQSAVTLRRCLIENFRNGRCINFTHTTTVDNAAHVVENCALLGGPGGGMATTRVGGITVRNTLFRHFTTHVQVLTAITVGQTVTINNCRFEGGTNGLVGTVSGEIVEDYNNFTLQTPRTNTGTGANSNTFLPLPDTRWWHELVA